MHSGYPLLHCIILMVILIRVRAFMPVSKEKCSALFHRTSSSSKMHHRMSTSVFSSSRNDQVTDVSELISEGTVEDVRAPLAESDVTPKRKRARPNVQTPSLKPKVIRDNLLIVGLGNPGSEYVATRHNIGFLVAEELSKRWGISLKSQSKFLGMYASTKVKGKSIGLLKPSTFMNLSGQSVKKVVDFFKLSSDNILVLTDDVSLDFGVLRFRTQGSAGGHNGLKSLESYLKTKQYGRLRIGVGAPKHDLVSHVLGEFSRSEKKEVDSVVNAAVWAVEEWIEQEESEQVKAAVNGKKVL